jgi:hypothetical protein
MRFCTKTLLALFAATFASTALSALGDDAPAGVVRISDRNGSPAATNRSTVYRAQSPEAVVGNKMCECGFPNCPGPNGWNSSGWTGAGAASDCDPYHHHHGFRRNDLKVGNGTYDITYAVNPCYFDRRDGRVFSAYGYGVPMAVPLAPNVGFAYNHGWGVPSSRLTPVSRPGYPCP